MDLSSPTASAAMNIEAHGRFGNDPLRVGARIAEPFRRAPADRQLPRLDDRSPGQAGPCLHQAPTGIVPHLQASSPVWNATVYNCISFVQDIARYIGLRVPGTHVIYPDICVNRLRQLNGGRENQVVALSNILAGSALKSAAPKTAEAPKNQSASAINNY